MAQVTFTIPNAVLAALDAWAQKRSYVDWRAYTIEWMKNNAMNIQREQNRDQARALTEAAPSEPNVT